MSQGQGGGRPTKYRKELIDKIPEYIEMCKKENHLPTIEGFSYFVDVAKDTTYAWIAKYPKFSYSLKKMLSLQASILQSGITLGGVNTIGGIFLLKNNHGFKDKTETDITTGGEKLPTPIMGINPDVHKNNSDPQDSKPKTED